MSAVRLVDTPSFDEAALPLALVDLRGRVVRANEALAAFLARPSEQIVGRDLAEFTHPDDVEAMQAFFAKAGEDGVPGALETRYLRRDGAVVWGRVTPTMVPDAGGASGVRVRPGPRRDRAAGGRGAGGAGTSALRRARGDRGAGAEGADPCRDVRGRLPGARRRGRAAPRVRRGRRRDHRGRVGDRGRDPAEPRRRRPRRPDRRAPAARPRGPQGGDAGRARAGAGCRRVERGLRDRPRDGPAARAGTAGAAALGRRGAAAGRRPGRRRPRHVRRHARVLRPGRPHPGRAGGRGDLPGVGGAGVGRPPPGGGGRAAGPDRPEVHGGAPGRGGPRRRRRRRPHALGRGRGGADAGRAAGRGPAHRGRRGADVAVRRNPGDGPVGGRARGGGRAGPCPRVAAAPGPRLRRARGLRRPGRRTALRRARGADRGGRAGRDRGAAGGALHVVRAARRLLPRAAHLQRGGPRVPAGGRQRARAGDRAARGGAGAGAPRRAAAAVAAAGEPGAARRRRRARFQQPARRAADPGRLARGHVEDPEALSRDLGQLAETLDRATHLAQRLTTFSRRDPVDPRLVDVAALVRQTEELFARTLGQVRLEVCPPADPLPPVLIDPGQLEQVLVNLVVNARDVMPRGGRITVETSVIDVGWRAVGGELRLR